MSHNLFGERFAYRGKPAWHGLGTQISDTHTSASDGMTVADIDYGIVTVPLTYVSPSDQQTVMSDRVVIIRPEWRGEPEAILGYAGRDYRPLQNWELAKLLDPLTTEWPLETVAALGKGEQAFFTLDAGVKEIGGDEVRQYVLAANANDGTTALRISLTPVRVVCQNTLITGLSKASVTASIQHTRRILEEAELALDLVSQIRRASEFTLEELEVLTHITLDPRRFSLVDFLKEVYPDPMPPRKLGVLTEYDEGRIVLSEERVAALLDAQQTYENKLARIAETRQAALERIFAFYEEKPAFAWTAWAAYQAIAEVETWKEGGSQKRQVQSLLLGGERGQTIARAYAALRQQA